MTNYGPISILPFFSKILEKVMFERTMNYMNNHNILYDNQYGFRHNPYTYMTLLVTIDRVLDALDRSNTAIEVLIDLPKASDSVNHNILSKLEHYGIIGLSYDWFNNYFSSRLQYVEVGGVFF